MPLITTSGPSVQIAGSRPQQKNPETQRELYFRLLVKEPHDMSLYHEYYAFNTSLHYFYTQH